MKGKVKVEGLKELDRALSELPAATAKRLPRLALMKAGRILAEAGRAIAPKGPTGNLKASYGVGTKLTRRQRKLHKKKSEFEVFVGPNDPAAVQTEFGNEHQAAEPHLRPAWDATQGQVLEAIKTELADGIAKSVARAERKAARLARKMATGG